jgi:hypothetical protein
VYDIYAAPNQMALAENYYLHSPKFEKLIKAARD